MTDPRIAVLSALSSPGWHPVPEAHGMPWDEAEQLLAAYDASRAAAAPSAPADRAAVLREAADIADRLMDERYGPDCSYAIGGEDVARELRRVADEAQQPETQADDEPPCTCAAAGDCFAPAGHYADCPAAVSQPGKEA
jgi:hypothetical protein